MHRKGIRSARITWWIRVTRLIGCILAARPSPARQMRLTFFTRRGGPVVARLTAEYGGCGVVSVRIDGRDMPGLSEYPRSGPPLQQQVLVIAGVSWPVEPAVPANLALLPDLVTRAPAAGWWFVQDRDPRPEQEFGVGVRRAVGLGDAVGEPQRCHALVGPVDLAEHVAGLASEPNDPGRPLACCGSAVSVHNIQHGRPGGSPPVAVMP
jgi:hypothetical protein